MTTLALRFPAKQYIPLLRLFRHADHAVQTTLEQLAGDFGHVRFGGLTRNHASGFNVAYTLNLNMLSGLRVTVRAAPETLRLTLTPSMPLIRWLILGLMVSAALSFALLGVFSAGDTAASPMQLYSQNALVGTAVLSILCAALLLAALHIAPLHRLVFPKSWRDSQQLLDAARAALAVAICHNNPHVPEPELKSMLTAESRRLDGMIR